VEIFAQIALCHRRQMHRVDEDKPQYHILQRRSDFFELNLLNLSDRFELFVNFIVLLVKFVKLCAVMSILLKSVPNLHLALSMVD